MITIKEAIEALERRADFLAKKIVDEPNGGRPLHRERQELGAIRIAITQLERDQKLREISV